MVTTLLVNNARQPLLISRDGLLTKGTNRRNDRPTPAFMAHQSKGLLLGNYSPAQSLAVRAVSVLPE